MTASPIPKKDYFGEIKQMKKQIYLVDGSAYIYRAFHAIKSLSTSDGMPTNAVFGFTRTLLKLIHDKDPEYISVFFDARGETFRHEIYKDYKANRPPMPDDLALQIPYVKKIIKAFNFPCIEEQGFEADDLIGTYARIAQENGFEVVMVTGDKDFMQLVTENAVIFDPMKDMQINIHTIKKDFSLSPDQIIDMLGLAGDASDNIPGVPGVGPKTAIKLLSEFKSIENLFENLDSLKNKKSLYKKLEENRDQAFLSRKLVVIDQYAPAEKKIEEFRIKPFNRKALSDLFKELEFKQLYTEFAVPKEDIAKTYQCVTGLDDIKNLVTALEKAAIFAVDTETTSQYPMLASLVGISFSFKPHTAFYIPLNHENLENHDQPGMKAALELIKPLLENPGIKKTGQNIKYDYIVLYRAGIEMQGIVFDTMIASHLLNPAVRSHSLDSIAMDLFNHKTIKYADVAGKGKKEINFRQVAITDAVDYACEDADITFMAHTVLEQQIRETHLKALMDTIEMPLVTLLARMEMTGIRVDREKLTTLSKSFEQELERMEKDIFALAGETFNINSSKQLGDILFEKLKLPVQKKTKKKTGYSTDVNVLKNLADHHELPEKILRYRSVSKLKSTYSDALYGLIHPETQRIHTSFNQTITATGRLSSSDPNLQNIPIKTREGRKIRETFIPEKGCVFVSADYSQIELRILAHCADDQILIEAFNRDEDIHARTAAEVFQVFPDMITEELRRQAKAINFGIIYGMSAFGLSKELNITRKMAQIYINSYFKRYKGVRQFIDTTIKETQKTGMVSTLLGRKRKISDINASNTNIRKFAERTAINTPIQGSAADLIKLAMINMEKRLKQENMNSRMLISVHDEIVFESPEQEKDQLIILAREVMEGVFDLKVPLKVNISFGDNWARAH